MAVESVCTTVLPWGFHPQVACLREFLGYTVEDDRSSESDDGSDDEDDIEMLKRLDPKDWKDQDHYSVLGIKKLRHKATESHIRKAYRKKVLLHHPDKRRSRGEAVPDESNDYFSCITKAFETLGNRDKRMSYDSVDPKFDDTVPSVEEGQKDFYKVFGNAFKENSRWSRRKPVPILGNDSTDFVQVEKFYTFWYNFDSWREFSYLDKEDKDKGENRDERRYIEKLNKSERAKMRQDELKRLRLLVDNARTCDPRILRHEKAIRDEREAKKKNRQNEYKRKREEEEQRAREEALAEETRRAEEEKRKKEEADQLKKEKEANKHRVKKEKKILRQFVEKMNYFDGGSHELRVKNMEALEMLCNRLKVEEFENLNAELKNASPKQAEVIFKTQIDSTETGVQKERAALLAAATAGEGDKNNAVDAKWSYEMTQTLIKAVNHIPVGTVQRWEAIADYINLHVPSANITGKEVLKKAKSLKKNDQTLKQEANAQAFNTFNTQVAQADACKDVVITDRCEAEARPWSADEQKLLEQALRNFPASVAERWDKISDAVATRTKKECMVRYKEIVEMVKAKKAAAAKK